MDTHSKQTRDNGQKPKRRMTAKQKAAKKKRRLILFGVEIVGIMLMLGLLYVLYSSTSNKPGPSLVDLAEEELDISPEVESNLQMEGYWNIALFGVDAVNEKQLQKGSRSDSMMIASINRETGDIKLVSVYRDTYLNIGNKYTKCNAAYNSGGGEQALKMLNSNLDMNIVDFVTIGYEGLATAIDGLGGVYIDVDKVELLHINNYQETIAKTFNMDKNKFTRVTETGYQLLNGMQATAYCRIRQTLGDDFKRASRQREVIKAIEEQAKKANLTTLTKVFNDTMQHVHTTLKSEDLLPLLGKINDYRIADEGGFPKEDMRDTGNIGKEGSCVIPTDLESNVIWLHHFLFEDEVYEVSERVLEYGAKIEKDTSPYLDSKK